MDFIKCGMLGWCAEVLWTGMGSVKKKDAKCTGNTSLLMFPIYGMACLLKPIGKGIKEQPVVVRGAVYTLCIFAMEYISGSILKKHNMCPWDYSDSKYNINGLVRLDYAPCWFSLGLIFERLLKTKEGVKT
ncbi:MAG: hypothetical protein E7269_01595 [Lachnospiraceae bacterium]|nr:hypothetical protein [Lachnospiraceae bacterium]